MIDRLAHDAFGLRENAVAQIDAMEPRFQSLQASENFVACHIAIREFCAWRQQPAPRRTLRSLPAQADSRANKREIPIGSERRRSGRVVRWSGSHRSGLR